MYAMACAYSRCVCMAPCMHHQRLSMYANIRRPRQGRCLEHFHFMCIHRPAGASSYIARHPELRGSLVGRLYLAGVFSGFLVFLVF